MKNIAFMVSGSGTNMQTILDGIAAGQIQAKPCAVLSTNSNAYALQRANLAGIDTYSFPLKKYPSAKERDLDVLKTLKKYQLDYIFLVGYLGIISCEILHEYPHKIINIHPSLLPRHGGKGNFGLTVHQKVLSLLDPFTGATTHLVNEGIDTGALLLQKSMPCAHIFSAEILQENVLKNCEHPLIFWTAKLLCEDKIIVQNGVPKASKKTSLFLKEMDIDFKGEQYD